MHDMDADMDAKNISKFQFSAILLCLQSGESIELVTCCFPSKHINLLTY